MKEPACEHHSATGTVVGGGNGEWVCDSCGYAWRDVDDPDGPCIRWVKDSPLEGIRFRKEPISLENLRRPGAP